MYRGAGPREPCPIPKERTRVKKVLIVLSLAAIAVIAFAATAQAHTLSFKRAAAVAQDVAQRDCNRDPDCSQFAAFKNDCRRGSQHRVRCFALNGGTDAGGDYVCERPVLVKMKKDSFNLLFVTGDRTCFRV
jgi:hypothetical protein